MKITTKLYNNVNYTIMNFSPHSIFLFSIIDNKCSTRRPASADRTARAANFRRDL